MNSDAARGATFRGLVIFAALLALTLALGIGGHLLTASVRTDLRHDVVWYRYGAPPELRHAADRWYPWTGPILQRWTFSGDPARVAYAQSTMARLGGWPARRWIGDWIDRNPEGDEGTSALYDVPAWRTSFGLDDAGRRNDLIARALHHMDADNAYTRVDGEFLRKLGADAWPAVIAAAQTAAPKTRPALLDLLPYDDKGLDAPMRATVAQLRAGLVQSTGDGGFAGFLRRTGSNAGTTYRALSADDRRSMLLDEAREPARAPAVRAFLAGIARDKRFDDGERILTQAVLHSEGDRAFDGDLRKALSGDLRALRSLQDFYLLLGLANDFADTRYVKAMHEYDAIRGGVYFGDDRDDRPLPRTYAARVAQAAREEGRWRAWLRAYPDHPGADDATFRLVRDLERQAHRADALGVLSDALWTPRGDGDMYGELWSRFLYLLDVGTTDADLDAWLLAHRGDPMTPFVTYARAVRYARVHDYAKASNSAGDLGVALRAFAARKPPFAWYAAPDADGVTALFNAQRALWQHLSDLVLYGPDKLHPELREIVIQIWSGEDGWKIPYLALYNGARMGGGGTVVPDAIDPAVLAENFRRANADATAIALTQMNLPEQYASAWVNERDRYRIVALLYRLAVEHPDDETQAMHPLPGFLPQIGSSEVLFAGPRDMSAVQAWYVRQAIVATRTLRDVFPRSEFAGSALLCVYEMSGETKYLDQIVAGYPHDDRAEEARAALYAAAHHARGG